MARAKEKKKSHSIVNRIVGYGTKPADQFQANPMNWRVHPEAQRTALAGVLESVGWAAPVIENVRTGHLIDGHERVWQALQAGVEVPYVQVDVSENEERTLLTTFDPIGAMAETDREALASLMADVQSDDARVQELIAGIAERENVILPDETGHVPLDDVPPEIDRAAELQKEWGTARGQVWTCGKHRVMCGDSTSADDVATLMDGKKAALCLTDPPYGIGELYDTISDTKEELSALIAKFFPLAQRNADVVMLTSGNSNHRAYPSPNWQLAWFTPAGVGIGPWGFSCWHPILTYGADPYLKNGQGGRPDALVLTESADNALGHPCSKPLKVWTWILERGSIARGDVILDPFLGSGTTLIAAEQTGRVCYGMEISPAYVAVTLQRYKDVTGNTPVLA